MAEGIQLASVPGCFFRPLALGPVFDFFFCRATVTFIVPDSNGRVAKASFNAAREASRDWCTLWRP